MWAGGDVLGVLEMEGMAMTDLDALRARRLPSVDGKPDVRWEGSWLRPGDRVREGNKGEGVMTDEALRSMDPSEPLKVFSPYVRWDDDRRLWASLGYWERVLSLVEPAPDEPEDGDVSPSPAIQFCSRGAFLIDELEPNQSIVEAVPTVGEIALALSETIWGANSPGYRAAVAEVVGPLLSRLNVAEGVRLEAEREVDRLRVERDGIAKVSHDWRNRAERAEKALGEDRMALLDRIAELEQWKREATEVIAEWDAIYDSVADESSDLGRTRASVVAQRLVESERQCWEMATRAGDRDRRIAELEAEQPTYVPMFSATKNNLYAGPPHSEGVEAEQPEWHDAWRFHNADFPFAGLRQTPVDDPDAAKFWDPVQVAIRPRPEEDE